MRCGDYMEAEAQGRLLLGFSKSGWGAWSLLLRHPDLFQNAAAWDTPLMMDKPDRYGSGDIFGTEANFEGCRVSKRPPGGGTALLLAKAASPEQASRVGDQTGGRVFLFLQTDDFWRDYHDMKARGVCFTEEPREEEYGPVAVFLDLYGNRWDLVQYRPTGSTTCSG